MSELRNRFDQLQTDCSKRFSALLKSHGSFDFYEPYKEDMDLEDAVEDSLIPNIYFTSDCTGDQFPELVLEITSDGELKTFESGYPDKINSRTYSEIGDMYYMISIIEAMEELKGIE